MDLKLNVYAYVYYLPITILLTLLAAHFLFKNSKVFMLYIFHGEESFAHSTNQLLKTGFYLVSLGFALFLMTIHHNIYETEEIFEILSLKLGLYTFYLGGMLVLSLWWFLKWKKYAKTEKLNMD